MTVSPGRLWSRPASRRRGLVVFAVLLSALLALLSALLSDVAQTQEQTWTGTVEVDTSTLKLEKGKFSTYRLRLTEPPNEDDWWVRIRVEGVVHIEGVYEIDGEPQVRWVPSVGREFDKDNYDQWRDVHVYVFDDASPGTSVKFTHEVWGLHGWCPVHNVGHVIATVGNPGTGTDPVNPVTDPVNPVTDPVNPVTNPVNPGPNPEDNWPKMSIANGTAEEGEVVELAVTLDKESTEVVTVTYRTGDVTATAGEDYTAVATGTLTFEAGERRKVIEVATSEDQLGEEDETFRVELSSLVGATLVGDGIGTGTIVDDDGGTGTPPEDTLPKMSIADGTAEEGEVVELAVTLDKESTDVVTVTYRTGDVTATAGEDYTAVAAGTLTFEAGERRKVIEVATIEDQLGEEDETFRVVLSGPVGATLEGDGIGTGTIIDDDGGHGDAAGGDPAEDIDSGRDGGRGRGGGVGGDTGQGEHGSGDGDVPDGGRHGDGGRGLHRGAGEDVDVRGGGEAEGIRGSDDRGPVG